MSSLWWFKMKLVLTMTAIPVSSKSITHMKLQKGKTHWDQVWWSFSTHNWADIQASTDKTLTSIFNFPICHWFSKCKMALFTISDARKKLIDSSLLHSDINLNSVHSTKVLPTEYQQHGQPLTANIFTVTDNILKQVQEQFLKLSAEYSTNSAGSFVFFLCLQNAKII